MRQSATRGLGECECANRVLSYGRMLRSDGSRAVIRYCASCGGRVSAQAVAEWRVEEEGHEIDELPLLVDYRDEGPECEVDGCTSTNTQLHHWAPRHIFGDDAWLWPTSHLCREKHHPEWHIMMTPEMSENGKRGE